MVAKQGHIIHMSLRKHCFCSFTQFYFYLLICQLQVLLNTSSCSTCGSKKKVKQDIVSCNCQISLVTSSLKPIGQLMFHNRTSLNIGSHCAHYIHLLYSVCHPLFLVRLGLFQSPASEDTAVRLQLSKKKVFLTFCSL